MVGSSCYTDIIWKLNAVSQNPIKNPIVPEDNREEKLFQETVFHIVHLVFLWLEGVIAEGPILIFR